MKLFALNASINTQSGSYQKERECEFDGVGVLALLDLHGRYTLQFTVSCSAARVSLTTYLTEHCVGIIIKNIVMFAQSADYLLYWHSSISKVDIA